MAYRGTEAIDYNRMQSSAYGSAAVPKRKMPGAPERRQVQKPRVIEKTRAQLRAESRRSRAKALKVLMVCTVFFSLIAFQIYSRVQVDELDRQLDTINSEISILDSENTRLNMQLDSIISLDKVDEYAQNTLGMVKVENYQVSYVDLSKGDKVSVSGGKVHRSLWETMKAYFHVK